MRADEPLTTSQVARWCRVTPVAVWKWIKQGKLAAYKLSNGQYRIERRALKAYLQANDLPVPPDLVPETPQRILIVDDEPTTVEILVRTLQRLGRKVELATAGDGFVAGLQLATFKPSLLVLDLMMPQIDGFEVCRIVRRDLASTYTKILIVTAYGDHDNIARALEAGANDFLHKPIDISQLTEKVQALLED